MYEYVRICTNAYEYVRIKFFIFNINQIDNAKIVPWLNHCFVRICTNVFEMNSSNLYKKIVS